MKMDQDYLRRRCAELARSRPDPGSDAGALAEAALFIEEVFGIALSDEDITEQKLGTHRYIERFLHERLASPSLSSRDEIAIRLAEHSRTRPDPGADVGALTEAALYIEEVFGLKLSDGDMTQERLGSHEAMERFVRGRFEV